MRQKSFCHHGGQRNIFNSRPNPHNGLKPFLKCGEIYAIMYLQGIKSHYLQLKLLSGKNVRAWVSMDFTQDKFSAPITIKKIKILGAVLELPAKQHCQSSPSTSKLGHIGQIGSAV